MIHHVYLIHHDLKYSNLVFFLQRKNEDYIYIASHQARTSLLVLVGSNFEDGGCIRGLGIKKGQIEPCLGFKENNQRVRCSWYSENVSKFITYSSVYLIYIILF